VAFGGWWLVHAGRLGVYNIARLYRVLCFNNNKNNNLNTVLTTCLQVSNISKVFKLCVAYPRGVNSVGQESRGTEEKKYINII